MCNAIVKMSEVVIDTTLQRPVKTLGTLLKYLTHFSQSMVMSIQVYKEVNPR